MKKIKKVPIQIYLEPEQEKIIGVLSKRTGKSKAAIIRLCISKFVDTLPPDDDPALNIVGIGESGKRDISKRHDDYLISLER